MPLTIGRSRQPAKYPQQAGDQSRFPKDKHKADFISKGCLMIKWCLMITLSWDEECDEKTWRETKQKATRENNQKRCPD